MSDIVSRPYRPDPQQCCEACCFGGFKHALFCEAKSFDLRDFYYRTEKEFARASLNGPDDFRRDIDTVIREGKK